MSPPTKILVGIRPWHPGGVDAYGWKVFYTSDRN